MPTAAAWGWGAGFAWCILAWDLGVISPWEQPGLGSGEGCVKAVAKQKPLPCLPALGIVDPGKGLLDVPYRPGSEAGAKRRPVERGRVFLDRSKGAGGFFMGDQRGSE